MASNSNMVSPTNVGLLLNGASVNITTTATAIPHTNQTSDNATTLSSNGADDFQLVFNILIVIIGVTGMLANALVALALKQSKSANKERVNILMLNQMILDMYSCAMLATIYAVRIGIEIVNLYLTSTWGHWLCVLFLAETPLWIGLNGSTANLVMIAVERYVMIVHPIWHKNHVRSWMIHIAVSFCWIEGILLNVPLLVLTSRVVNGQCVWVEFWPSQESANIYSIWYFIFVYVLALVAFCFCYGRILAVVNRQGNVVKSTATAAANATGETTSQAKANRAKMNVIKTMVTITALFIACWMPNTVYYFAITVNRSLKNDNFYLVSVFLAFFNISFNPFVYAGQYDVIRRRLNGVRVYFNQISNRSVGTTQPHESIHTVGLHPSASINVVRVQSVM